MDDVALASPIEVGHFGADLALDVIDEPIKSVVKSTGAESTNDLPVERHGDVSRLCLVGSHELATSCCSDGFDPGEVRMHGLQVIEPSPGFLGPIGGIGELSPLVGDV